MSQATEPQTRKNTLDQFLLQKNYLRFIQNRSSRSFDKIYYRRLKYLCFTTHYYFSVCKHSYNKYIVSFLSFHRISSVQWSLNLISFRRWGQCTFRAWLNYYFLWSSGNLFLQSKLSIRELELSTNYRPFLHYEVSKLTRDYVPDLIIFH